MGRDNWDYPPTASLGYFRALVYVFGRISDRVVAFVIMSEIFLNDLIGHAGAFASGFAAVIDTIKVEMDADAIGEGIFRVIWGGQ